MATKNGLSTRFSYTAMRNLMDYLVTRNHESQTIAVDANLENIESTGGKGVTINGVQCILAADAALDISAELPYAAWAAATGYTTAGILSEVTSIDSNGAGVVRHYTCILAHTSSAAGAAGDEPGVGANWKTYWRELKVWAEDATGYSQATGTTRDYLVCALADGTLRIFKAFNSAGTRQIPAYDPTRYVAVAIMSVANASVGAYIVGTTLTDVADVVETFEQLTGFVFPDVTLLEWN